jgi:3'(2'), 5'-bisphosphate nucleotidase
MTNPELNNLLLLAIRAAFMAGNVIMKVYGSDRLVVKRKKDFSPLTQADQYAHDVIMKLLEPEGIPVISEEGHQYDYQVRKNWENFWLVDPLDGTREFLKRNGEFTVNIALIKNNLPLIGVIYSPPAGQLYWGIQDNGAYLLSTIGFREKIETDILQVTRLSERLPYRTDRNNFTVVASRSHISFETHNYIRQLRKHHKKLVILSKGSSLKFCLVAEGKADIYPRFGPTMEWDTAAGQAIAISSGCTVRRNDTGDILTYNKKDLHNPWFIVSRERIG